MKATRLDKLRYAWTELILCTVEKLPPFQGGAVNLLQERMRSAREYASRDLKIFGLPPGFTIAPKSFTLISAYPLEEFDRLADSLRRTFPEQGRKVVESRIDDIEESAATIWSGSWSLVGDMSRSNYGFVDSHRRVADLPIEVKRVEVRVYKVLPSLHVVAFRATLSDKVGPHLMRLYSTPYMPKAVFHHWLPFGKRAFLMSRGNSASVQKEAILGYLEGIERATQRALDKWFAEARLTKGNSLPVIREFHSETAIPAGQVDDVVEKAGRMWASAIGLESYYYNRFECEKCTIALSDHTGSEALACTLVVERSAENDGLDEFREAELCYSLVPSLAIYASFQASAAALGDLRTRIYSRALGGKRARFFLNDMNLHQRIQVHRFVAERLRVELPLAAGPISQWAGHLKQFTHIQGGPNLFASFQSRYSHLEKSLISHNALINDISQSYLQGRNLAITHRLSRYVLFLTIIATLMTVFAGFSNIDSSMKWIKAHSQSFRITKRRS